MRLQHANLVALLPHSCTGHWYNASQFNYFERPWDKIRKLKHFGEGMETQPSMERTTSEGNVVQHSSFSYDHATLDHPECVYCSVPPTETRLYI